MREADVVMMPLWQRALLILGSSVAYLWLAALGWGDLGALLAHPALLALAVATLLIAAGSVFIGGGNLSSGEREDRGNRWVIVAFALIGLLDGYVPALADRLGILTFGGDALRWIGVVLFVVGCGLRIWPVVVLGDRFSGLVAIQPGHTLVTTGVYAVIRNPSYLGLLVTMIGWALAFRGGAGLVLAALIVPPLVARIAAEERLLHDRFGAAYDAYRARTWRLIPSIY